MVVPLAVHAHVQLAADGQGAYPHRVALVAESGHPHGNPASRVVRPARHLPEVAAVAVAEDEPVARGPQGPGGVGEPGRSSTRRLPATGERPDPRPRRETE